MTKTYSQDSKNLNTFARHDLKWCVLDFTKQIIDLEGVSETCLLKLRCYEAIVPDIIFKFLKYLFT